MGKKPLFARRLKRAECQAPKKRLETVPPKQVTGFMPTDISRHLVARFEETRYVVHDTPLIGDAPKAFVSVFEAGCCQKAVPASWPRYIAKVGHKRYPTESITEHLLTRIGQCFGLNMAQSRLMSVSGQLRFMSRYFLEPDEILLHGAQIVSSYLEDPDFDGFAGDVRKAKLEAEIFNFQELSRAILTRFPMVGAGLVEDLVRVIAFDTLVGNQDRHLYNWGVITHARIEQLPRLAPIFDTARALFWNDGEGDLKKYHQAQSMAAYVQNSRPVIGVEKMQAVKHFDLMYAVAAENARYISVLNELKNGAALAETSRMIDTEFGVLLSDQRRRLIKQCLTRRFDRYCEVLEEC
jgi:hypothetical protein